ncbi:MAG: hypothetical protein E7K47_15005, partial [Acidovorax sp.]|nr:hypothetical protein [Acidovorax sp.]
ALAQLEVETGTAIAASVDPATLDRWRASVSELLPDGQTQCVFQTKLDTDSTANWTVIPEQSGQ